MESGDIDRVAEYVKPMGKACRRIQSAGSAKLCGGCRTALLWGAGGEAADRYGGFCPDGGRNHHPAAGVLRPFGEPAGKRH